MSTSVLPGALRPFRVELRARTTIRQLEYALPALALLWVPVVVAWWAHLPGYADLERGVPMLRAMLIGGLAPLLVAAGMARLRARTWPGAARLLWSEGWLSERPIRHVLMSVSLAAFFWAFACWKAIIPQVHPFAWDERLRTFGALIHRGQPDVLLAPLFGSPHALLALDHLYESWWFVLFGLLLWQIWQPELEKSKRFLLAFALTWIVLGIFAATAFSSAGPCYARWVTGTHRYDVLYARLEAANLISPLTALQAQAYLWGAYVRGLVPPGGGISAFPSLHVGGATLVALALYERNRAAGIVAWIYVVLTWVASVMLGWHYAIDGEAAIVAVVICWHAAGLLTTPLPAPVARVPRVPPAYRGDDHGLQPVFAASRMPADASQRRSYTLWQ